MNATLMSKAKLTIPGVDIHISINPHDALGTPTPTAQGVGNPSSVADTIGPVTTSNITGTADGNGIYTSDILCTLTAVDNEVGSEVSITQYSFDRSDWFTYQEPFSVVKPGMTTVCYRSADNAGNVEVANVRAIVVAGTTQEPSPSPGATATPGLSAVLTALGIIGTAAILVSGRAGKR